MLRTRNKCIICKSNDLEKFITFENIPIYMGCQYDREILKNNQSWLICKKCDCILLEELIPLEILYKHSHNAGFGITWKKHYDDFSLYIINFCGQNICEIGAGNCKLANNLIEKKEDIIDYYILKKIILLMLIK